MNNQNGVLKIEVEATKKEVLMNQMAPYLKVARILPVIFLLLVINNGIRHGFETEMILYVIRNYGKWFLIYPVFLGFLYQSYGKAWDTRLDKDEQAIYSLTSSGVEYKAGSSEIKCSWDKVEQITLDKRVVCIQITENFKFLIPVRCIVDFKEFEELIRAYYGEINES